MLRITVFRFLFYLVTRFISYYSPQVCLNCFVCFALYFVCSVFFYCLVYFLFTYRFVPFLFVYKCTDHCHRLKTQLYLSKYYIISNKQSHPVQIPNTDTQSVSELVPYRQIKLPNKKSNRVNAGLIWKDLPYEYNLKQAKNSTSSCFIKFYGDVFTDRLTYCYIGFIRD
jgi:hypothetical protein